MNHCSRDLSGFLKAGQYINGEWVCWSCIADEAQAHIIWEEQRMVEMLEDAGFTVELVNV